MKFCLSKYNFKIVKTNGKSDEDVYSDNEIIQSMKNHLQINTHLNAEFQRIARKDKPSSVLSAKKQRKTKEWERLEISS